MLDNIAAMSRMLDAETVVVGMRPAVAITLVELGLALTGVRTALNVEQGMELVRRRRSSSESGRPCASRRLIPFRSAVLRGHRQGAADRPQWAIEVGFSLVDQTKIVTAASELARNTRDYGGGGTVRWRASAMAAGVDCGLTSKIRGRASQI